MIRKLKSGEYRLYSKKKNPKTNKRRNLGTFDSLEQQKNMNRMFSILSGIKVQTSIVLRYPLLVFYE